MATALDHQATRDQRVVTYVSPADAEHLDQLAGESHISRSAMARQLLCRALADQTMAGAA